MWHNAHVALKKASLSATTIREDWLQLRSHSAEIAEAPAPYTLSTNTAMPWPPLTHRVAMP